LGLDPFSKKNKYKYLKMSEKVFHDPFEKGRKSSRPIAHTNLSQNEILQVRSINLFYVVYNGFYNDAEQIMLVESKKNSDNLKKNLNKRVEEGGETLLHVACDRGYLNIVQLLVKHGADIDKKEFVSHRTALEYSVAQEHWDIALFLYEKGASIHNIDPSLKYKFMDLD
jgi:ankyrin repeat protein